MQLSEIFEQLSYGELSQLSIGGNANGIIDESNYKRVLSHINLGLNDLYKRFNIKTKQLKILLVENEYTYHLNSEYALSNRRSRVTNKYIQDSYVMPFEDDINKIEKVLLDDDSELELNNRNSVLSCYTPNLTTLIVPDLTNKTEFIRIEYRASFIPITIGLSVFDPTKIEVDLPITYLEALLYFVASRVNNPIGMSNEFHAGNSYAAKYEQACALLHSLNIEVDQGDQNSHLRRNGWV